MRVIIAGGTGLVGSKLADRLEQAGHKVFVLTRNPQQAQSAGSVEAVKWDGHTAAGWGKLASEADVIVNLTGENIGSGRWTAAKKESILSSRKNTGRAIVEAVHLASPRPSLVIQAAGVGYYGMLGDEVVNEEMPAGPDWLAHVGVRWEESTRPVEEMGVRRVVARTGVVLTPKGGILARMALPFRLFVGGPLGSGKQWVSWIHIEDLIRAYQFFIENEAATGVFNVTSPNSVRNADFGRALAKLMRRPYWAPVPGFALRLVLGQMSMLVLEGQRVVPERLIESGFSFVYPELEQALRNLMSK